MALNIRMKIGLCFLCEMLKFIRKSESLISTKFQRPTICFMKKKEGVSFLVFFLNHLLIMKCEREWFVCVCKSRVGVEGCKGKSEQVRLAGPKELSAE